MKKNISMKSSLVAAAAVAVGTLSTEVHAILIAYEGFSTPAAYTAGTDLATQTGDGIGWTSNWSNTLANGSSGVVTSESSSLTYSTLPTTAGSAVGPTSGNTRVDTYTRSFSLGFSPTDGDEVWMSALVDLTTDGDRGWQVALSNTNTFGSGVGFGASNGNAQTVAARIQGQSGSVVANNVGVNFYVARTSFTSGNPVVDVWVNPALTEDLASVAVGGGDSTFTRSYGAVGSISNVVFYSHQDNRIVYDEIRIGTTQQDVGITAIPEPSVYAAAFAIGALGVVMIRRHKI
ncbi:hypothetical protein [Rubellicoccus peritrichatus]|uniref:PEP-CTERM protein-sorting domain-containing protein n=1 Tax=Rubellicoccus peritrichatus TaxID=3080537 RepID=A0AAQ3QXQ5_9BACT|nr:hypothetical protein [Puniceicoccus sp. CR14]WOO43277.1 hypothetical protein RZN69_09260 [Puniceicoccus sp. CR14]